LRNRYFRGGEQYGNSNEEHVISGPLRSAAIANSVEYYFDQDSSGGLFNDSKLVAMAAHERPDLIVLCNFNPTNKRYPSIDLLSAIRSKLQVPILMMWPDSTSQGAVELAKKISGVSDLNVMLDSNNLAEQFSESPKYLQLWTALDMSVFYPGEDTRNIEVSFLGTTGGFRRIRETYLDYLTQNGAPLHRPGGQYGPMALEDYASVLRRSKMSINFSHSVGDTHQIKGRVFEVMFSGAMLLESANAETSKFFTPMVDYVEFDSQQDLLEKTNYYLAHESERKEIAQNGFLKATTQYNYRTFWNQISDKLEELELSVAPF